MGNCFFLYLGRLDHLQLVGFVACHLIVVSGGGHVWFFQFVEVHFCLLISESAVFNQVHNFHGC